MNVLIIGSGGREHAMAWKINQSPECENLYVLPGNAGTSAISTTVKVSINDFEAIGNYVLENNIALVVVGPEEPLVKGIVNYFKSHDQLKEIVIVGPDQTGARLEGSKDFAKEFMEKHQIPTAAYKTFNAGTIEEGKAFIDQLPTPIVLKADGLAAGKGVLIIPDHQSAKTELEAMLIGGKFGKAGTKVVIEQFLNGIELSVFVLTDGKNYVILPEAKDYKRIGENDEGPNTGGMGAVSPVPFADSAFMDKVEQRIIKPTVDGFQKDNIDYCGFIFIGLMNVNGDPYVIEYNVRMGDPETQAVLTRIDSDLLPLLFKAGSNDLHNASIEISSKTATTVVMVSGGYPGSYEKGNVISGLENIRKSIVFHAGTTNNETGDVITNGGRVLAITGLGDSVQEALDHAYDQVHQIRWKDHNFRADIGQDLLRLIAQD